VTATGAPAFDPFKAFDSLRPVVPAPPELRGLRAEAVADFGVTTPLRAWAPLAFAGAGAFATRRGASFDAAVGLGATAAAGFAFRGAALADARALAEAEATALAAAVVMAAVL
jgi:hypothetical protein